jgi:uroporphyrinogen decarboxylase
MNHRERYLATMTFGRPDRVPFHPGGPRESTLAAWRTQGLAEGADWQATLLATLGIEPGAARGVGGLGVDFRMVPQFEEKVLGHQGGHLVVQDWKGNVCEISDRFDVSYLREARDFVTRRWLHCPVEGPADWEQMKQRYRADSPGRLPEDWRERCWQAASRDGALRLIFNGPFWQLREWCGFEGLCMMTLEQPDLVEAMADFWTGFVAAMLEKVFGAVTPDAILICEDMAYKGKAMISPAMTRRFCMPAWKRWAAIARGAGVSVLEVDSDGFVGELAPLWVESGLNACSPMEVAAGCDINDLRRQLGRSMAFCGGVDKRCIAKGGQAIRDELARIEPVIRDGGFIPSCDHGIPGDVSWPAFVDYAGLLARMTGWL